jgi:transposase-like protein
MSFFNSRHGERSASDTHGRIQPQCPACDSGSVTTTAKRPDANSYWRCERCGEVWNASRRYDLRPAARTWR